MPETGSNKLNFSYKCALVPKQFFEPSQARATLIETVDVDDSERVGYVDVPFYGAVLVYAVAQGIDGEAALPELYHLLKASEGISEHNKIVASYCDGRVFLVVAEDNRMLLCNSFKAMDFTTAEYFIFMVLKKFQMNPEISAIYFHTLLTSEQEMSLYRYFRAVEQI